MESFPRFGRSTFHFLALENITNLNKTPTVNLRIDNGFITDLCDDQSSNLHTGMYIDPYNALGVLGQLYNSYLDVNLRL